MKFSSIFSPALLVVMTATATPISWLQPGAVCCELAASDASRQAPSAVAARLELVQQLAGTWVEVGVDGTPTERVVSRYSVIAGGNAVQEALFPGTENEMASLYHVDGDALILTHYCVLGSHPRMNTSIDPESNELVFTCTGNGLNFRSCGSVRHMHEGRVRRIGADRLESRWTLWSDGKPQEPATFSLVRVSGR